MMTKMSVYKLPVPLPIKRHFPTVIFVFIFIIKNRTQGTHTIKE